LGGEDCRTDIGSRPGEPSFIMAYSNRVTLRSEVELRFGDASSSRRVLEREEAVLQGGLTLGDGVAMACTLCEFSWGAARTLNGRLTCVVRESESGCSGTQIFSSDGTTPYVEAYVECIKLIFVNKGYIF
jgi:hypothetical protein